MSRFCIVVMYLNSVCIFKELQLSATIQLKLRVNDVWSTRQWGLIYASMRFDLRVNEVWSTRQWKLIHASTRYPGIPLPLGQSAAWTFTPMDLILKCPIFGWCSLHSVTFSLTLFPLVALMNSLYFFLHWFLNNKCLAIVNLTGRPMARQDHDLESLPVSQNFGSTRQWWLIYASMMTRHASMTYPFGPPKRRAKPKSDHIGGGKGTLPLVDHHP